MNYPKSGLGSQEIYKLYTLVWNWSLPLLITLSLINGIIKALTGIRYGPLVIDAILVILVGISLLDSALNHELRIGQLDLIAILFLLFAIFEMFNPNIPSFQAGLEGFRKFAFMTIGFFIGRHVIRNTKAIRFLIASIIMSSFVISLYGVKQFLYPTSLDFRLIDLSSASRVTYLMGGHIRSFSTMSSPFHLGIFMVCSALLLLAIAQYQKQYRIWLVILGIPQVVALVFTVTKSNWFALIIGGITLLILTSKEPIRIIIRILVLGFVALALIWLAFFITKDIPELRTVNDGLQAFVNPLAAPTFKFRIGLWAEEVVPMIAEAPILGNGTGSAGEGLAFLFADTGSKYVVSHNLIFKIQLELGLIGLLMFFLLIGTSLVQIWLVRKGVQEPLLRLFSNWTLAFTSAVAVAGITGAILDAYPVNLIFWFLIGISTRLYQYQPRQTFIPDRLAVASQ